MKKVSLLLSLLFCITQTASAVMITNKKQTEVSVSILKKQKTTFTQVHSFVLQPGGAKDYKPTSFQNGIKYFVQYDLNKISTKKVPFSKKTSNITITN